MNSKTIRSIVNDLDALGTEGVLSIIERLKEAGAVSHQHVGLQPNEFTSEMTVEWYAGQLLDTLESESYFAVNSFINTLDKFVPDSSTNE